MSIENIKAVMEHIRVNQQRVGKSFVKCIYFYVCICASVCMYVHVFLC